MNEGGPENLLHSDKGCQGNALGYKPKVIENPHIDKIYQEGNYVTKCIR